MKKMTTAIEQELEEVKVKWQQTQQELNQSKAELHEATQDLEELRSQLHEALRQLKQSRFELDQHQNKSEQNQSQFELDFSQKLKETQSKLRETEQQFQQSQSQLQETFDLLGQYHSQIEKTMEVLEHCLSQLKQNDKQLEQAKLQLHQAQQSSRPPESVALHRSNALPPVFPSKYQQLQIKSARETLVVAGVTMFKDEEDIAYHNLSWHYNQGIKRFVVLDNMSSDNTPNEVRRFANDYQDAQVYLIQDPEIGYYQSRKMTAAAEFAHKMWNAEWILPFDADEILCSFRGPLHTILESVDRDHICISLPYKVHVLRSFYDPSEPNPFKRITHRHKDDVEKGAKIILRWKSGMVIGQGNHNVTWDEQLLPMIKNKNLGLMLRHYPFRSKEHIRQKIINGGRAYAAAKNLPQNQGGAWRQWDKDYQTKGEEYIEELYANHINGFPDAIYDPAML